MMRFILDCLRPGRQRAGCGRENSVELQTKEKEVASDNEIKGLEDVVAMEEGSLQKDRAVRHDSQQGLELLAQRRAQLREQIEGIVEQRKQEGQLLLSLREEQEELEQTAQEYEEELRRARKELQRLREEIGGARTKVEEAHERMGPLRATIGDTYTEISEAKQRLGELITEMTAIEVCVPEIACLQTDEPMHMALNSSSREEEEDGEVCCGRVCKDENTLTQTAADKKYSKQETNEETLERLQRSMENLKSSGSSSFTEITLTEAKEEGASPRSITPQHMDSADLEEEDFEIVQSLVTKPVSQAASREFDFFNPDPFIDADVFGDDRFPKVDMTEFLSGDPFKGTNPFPSDILFNDVADVQFVQDYPFTEPSKTKESNQTMSSDLGANINDKHADTSSEMVPNLSDSNCSQSVDSGMFEQNQPEPSDSERHTPYSDICSEAGMNMTTNQEFDSMDLQNRQGIECNLTTSTQLKVGGRLDTNHCELDIPESGSSNTSTVNSSFDGDFGTFIGMEHPDPEGQPEDEVGPTYVRANQTLYGLQRIDTSLYTRFPLSPEGYDPEPEVPTTAHKDQSVHMVDSFALISDHSTVSESKLKTENSEHVSPHTDLANPGNPSPLCHEFTDVNSDTTDQTNKDGHSPETTETDADEHKFGDIYFFTVRLDPSSPDASSVSAEASDRRQSESDHVSPESNDTDEFNCGAPEEENQIQTSHEAYAEEGLDKEEFEIRTEQSFSNELENRMHSECELRNPESPYSEPQSAGLAFLDHMYNSECNDAFNLRQENMETVEPVYTADTKSESCNPEPIVQYLICPVKLCGHNSSLESSFIDHCSSLNDNPEPLDSEKNTVKEANSCDAEIKCLNPASLDVTTSVSEVKQPNSVYSASTDSGRLDSGYHENSGPDPFSPALIDTLPLSGDIGPGPQTKILGPGNLDQPVLDPFSPESSDTLMFDSELDMCNPATNDGVTKDSCLLYMASSDMLGDSFSGSEIDSFDPFSPVPHITGGHYMDILVPGSIQNHSKSGRETRSSSWDSGVSHSPQLHCSSALNREDAPPLPEVILVDPQPQNFSYLSNCSIDCSLLKSSSSNMTDIGSCKSEVENVKELDNKDIVHVTAMADLAEIDFFCSELSKMVASRSSDSVQQSVAEMLFGSNPDTAKFYPWDLENSNTVVNEHSKAEVDFGHTLDDGEKPSLL